MLHILLKHVKCEGAEKDSNFVERFIKFKLVAGL